MRCCCPARPITAPPIDEADTVIAFTRQAFVAPFNISGHPVVSIPTGFDADGMPTAVQLVGQLFDEARLLGLSAVCECMLPPRHPALGEGAAA